jgi:putative toxin-antitoxin system antitoxin component (TIGR02293 family)
MEEVMATSAKPAGNKPAQSAMPVKTPRRSAAHKIGNPKPAPVARDSSSGIGIGIAFRFTTIFLAQPQERILAIKQGVPASHVGALAARMAIPKEQLIDTLRLSRATVDRKARSEEPLSQDESERVLGIEYLIGQVENMVIESGNPEGFDAAKWISGWLNSPLPALNNQTPASYMDTIEGQKMVSNLLATVQSGAYV